MFASYQLPIYAHILNANHISCTFIIIHASKAVYKVLLYIHTAVYIKPDWDYITTKFVSITVAICSTKDLKLKPTAV